jgi:uncharacterized ferredoxin-like protein
LGGRLTVDKKLKIIPEPKEGTRTVIVRDVKSKLPYFKGAGNLNLVCGNCGFVLCKKINEGQIRNIVMQCPECGLFNDT